MSRIVILIALSLFALLGAARPVAAQDATPTGGQDTAHQSECTVEPATAGEILELFREVAATPIAASPTVVEASPTPFVQPEGEPADAETTAAIEAANHELVACTNAHGFLGLVAVSTDDHIRDILAQDISAGFTEEALIEFLAATPEPTPPDQGVVVVDVRDVTVLDDGRIGSVVIGDEPGAGEVTVYFIFAEVDGRYLLDDSFDLPSDATPAT